MYDLRLSWERLLQLLCSTKWTLIYYVSWDASLLHSEANPYFHAPQGKCLVVPTRGEWLFLMIHEVDTLFEADCYVLCQADIYLSCPVRRTPTSFVRKNEYLLIKLSKLDAYFLGPQERPYLLSWSLKQILIHCTSRGGCLFLMLFKANTYFCVPRSTCLLISLREARAMSHTLQDRCLFIILCEMVSSYICDEVGTCL